MSDNQQQFALQRIYIKDLSFEAPMGPELFRQPWKPKVKLDLATRNSKLEDHIYEVVLTLTITAHQDDKTAFLIEVQQAGLFLCKGLLDEQLAQVLGSVCPNILFPYAREAVDSLALKGSFPPLMIAPVNFDALYQQASQKQSGGAEPAPPTAH